MTKVSAQLDPAAASPLGFQAAPSSVSVLAGEVSLQQPSLQFV